MAYALLADVQARVAPRTIDGTSKPTDTMVTGWIAKAESLLNGELAAAGFATPITEATNGIPTCADKVAARVAARVLLTKGTKTDDASAAANDLVLAQEMLKEWDAFIADARNNPARLEKVLGQAPALGSTSASSLRSYATDNSDGLSVSNGDFDPAFTINTKL